MPASDASPDLIHRRTDTDFRMDTDYSIGSRMSTMPGIIVQQHRDSAARDDPATMQRSRTSPVMFPSGLDEQSQQSPKVSRRPRLSVMIATSPVASQLGSSATAEADSHAADASPAPTAATPISVPPPFNEMSSFYEDIEGGDEEAPSCRHKVFNFFEHPSSSKSARVVSIITMLVIVTSSVTLCIETLPSVHDSVVWWELEVSFVVYFTTEYMIRLWAAPDRWRYCREPMNILDLASVLPFYVQEITRTDSAGVDLRVLRLFRVGRIFRILRIRRIMGATAVVYQVLVASEDVLLLGGFLLMIVIVVFSTCIYYLEREVSTFNETDAKWWRKVPVKDVWEISPFQSVIHAFWWCIVTIMTVGYGDDVPVSPLGQVFATLCMLTGLLILSLPTSVIASNFLRMHRIRMKYGTEWQLHLGSETGGPTEGMTPLQVLDRSGPIVLDYIVELEAGCFLSPVYAAWAQVLMRDPEWKQDAALIFAASQEVATEVEMRRRFVHNFSELVDQYVQSHAGRLLDLADSRTRSAVSRVSHRPTSPSAPFFEADPRFSANRGPVADAGPDTGGVSVGSLPGGDVASRRSWRSSGLDSQMLRGISDELSNSVLPGRTVSEGPLVAASISAVMAHSSSPPLLQTAVQSAAPAPPGQPHRAEAAASSPQPVRAGA